MDRQITINLPFAVPFAIPFVEQTGPSTVVVDRDNLVNFLRITVVVCTYLTFRPHLERLFRRLLGRDDPAALPEVRERIRTLESERVGTQAATSPAGKKKKVTIVEGTGGSSSSSSSSSAPAASASSPAGGKTKARRKA